MLTRMPFHPLLLGIYPLLALLVSNISEIDIAKGTRSVWITLGLILLVWLVLLLVFRNWGKAALGASLVLLVFFAQAHVQPYYWVVVLLAAALFVWLFFWQDERVASVNVALNVAGIVLVALAIYQLSTFERAPDETAAPLSTPPVNVEATIVDEVVSKPDVYLFILDAYPRADFLAQEFGYDNQPFVDALEAMGLYVGQCSQSNYLNTRLTLSSMYNMQYVDELTAEMEPPAERLEDLDPFIQSNTVRATFEELGYDILAFEMGNVWAEWRDADQFIFLNDQEYLDFYSALVSDQLLGTGVGELLFGLDMNDFEWFLVQTTALKYLFDTIDTQSAATLDEDFVQMMLKYQLVRFVFDEIRNVPDIPGPKFTLIHILLPHHPYPFTADGGLLLSYEDEDQAFVDQIAYLNSQMVPTIEHLMATSEQEPIIIVMGDHGVAPPGSGGGSSDILNVYNLPDGGEDLLYPTISPINTFRLIFSHYFGLDVDLLDDRSFVSGQSTPLDFIEVENSRSDCNIRFP